MKITVDENSCIGCGICEAVCKDCFKVEEGIAKVTRSECTDDCKIKEVMSVCPVDAIKFTEND